MSLFENDEFQWRETYFVLFDTNDRPSTDAVQTMLTELNKNYELRDVRAGEDGKFESLTLVSPDDYAAMDLTCVAGDELLEQIETLAHELREMADPEEMAAISKISKCTARMDIFHFEQMVFVGSTGSDDELDDFMDPGSLLVVLERIAELCGGIVVDPQSNSIL